MIVYVVVVNSGVDTVRSTPEAAIAAKEKLKTPMAYIAVRPLDADDDTEESEAARLALREMERNLHNGRAQAIRDAQKRKM